MPFPEFPGFSNLKKFIPNDMLFILKYKLSYFNLEKNIVIFKPNKKADVPGISSKNVHYFG